MDAGADAGTVDGGSDSGVADAGVVDAGLADAGPDLTPPMLVILKQPPPRPILPQLYWDLFHYSNADWKVSEDPMIAVGSSSSDIDLASLSLEVILDGGTLGLGTGVSTSTGCACSVPCACFRVDRAMLPRIGANPPDDLWGTYAYQTIGLRASGTDAVGNRATVGGDFSVTRVLWEWGLDDTDAGQVDSVLCMPPTIDPDGNLYFMSRNQLTSLTPLGAVRWRVPGAFIALLTPFVFDEYRIPPPLYIPVDGGVIVRSEVPWPDDGGRPTAFVARSALSGADEHACSPPFPWTPLGWPVTLRTTGRWVALLGGTDGGEDFLVSMRIGEGANGYDCETVPLPFRLEPFVNPVAMGDLLCMGGKDKRIHCGTVSDAGTWPVPATFSSISLTATLDPEVELRSLSAVREDAGFRIVGNVHSPDQFAAESSSVGVFVANPVTSLEEWTAPSSPLRFHTSYLTLGASPYGGFRAYMPTVSFPNWENKVAVMDLSRGQLESSPLELHQGTDWDVEIVIGSDGRLYVDSAAITVLLPDAGAPTRELLFSTSSGQCSMALDCNRLGGSGGVLYTVSDHARLQAIIVDSPGLDTRAPWPKKGRDPANSGNAGLDLLRQYRCPGAP